MNPMMQGGPSQQALIQALMQQGGRGGMPQPAQPVSGNPMPMANMAPMGGMMPGGGMSGLPSNPQELQALLDMLQQRGGAGGQMPGGMAPPMGGQGY